MRAACDEFALAVASSAPVDLAFLQQQAVAAYRAGRLADALQFCRQILKQLPDRPDVLSFAGMIALEMGDAAEAAELYGRAVRRRPDFAEAHYNLGNALMKLGRNEAAVEAYRRAAELKPEAATRRPRRPIAGCLASRRIRRRCSAISGSRSSARGTAVRRSTPTAR